MPTSAADTPRTAEPEHEPYYEFDGAGTVVRCCCGFYRWCESDEVAEAEYRNHVDILRTAAERRASRETMSSDVVERAKAALEGVTDGPWVSWKQRPGPRNECGVYPGNIVSDATKQIVVTQSGNVANSGFIAAARSLVPELVSEVERLRSVVCVEPGKERQ